ncbi:NAD(P)H oxidoreductase [Tenuibacillus multivorans]|uniref:Glutathione-regulated potassium-efflux system ancillary protein KefG n=2 Tax=Tenuibacillus multivorans TaxID=237069 RepID=A0A1H0CNV4_9BACI|nr:NAD(P)H oxidoreductase [Tenuibacillus multivorans]SDN59538.1 glutathione-regulated potassium-efflux system ancillary protein KefG [Tenuibacillus multivorans]
MHETNITLHEIYEDYPDWQIDVNKEQQLLLEHDRIIFQFPNYWYSYPPLLKKWFDDVLLSGWAFRGQHALTGKEFGVAISSGFSSEDYRFDGLHQHTIEQILAPFYATCHFIRGKTLPIFKSFEEELKTETDFSRLRQNYLLYLNKQYPYHRNTY